jgi:hypothetical protein
MSSRSACCERDGCRWLRGDGGGCLWFSAKLCRCAAMWVGLWVLDWELFLSMGGAEVAAPSELGDGLVGIAVGPAPFAAESESIANCCGPRAVCLGCLPSLALAETIDSRIYLVCNAKPGWKNRYEQTWGEDGQGESTNTRVRCTSGGAVTGMSSDGARDRQSSMRGCSNQRGVLLTGRTCRAANSGFIGENA